MYYEGFHIFAYIESKLVYNDCFSNNIMAIKIKGKGLLKKRKGC